MTQPVSTDAPQDLPLRSSDEIQGNILAGFAKDYTTFLLYSFPADVAPVRAWLSSLLPRVATTRQVTAFNDQFREARRSRGGDDPPKLKAMWINVSLTSPGLAKLAPSRAADLAPFASFTGGAAARAADLRDTGDSDPQHWVFGAPHQATVDAVVTVAADDRSDFELQLDRLRALAANHGLSVAFEQRGETLPRPRSGHEHFGFKDGISQPGVRGYTPVQRRNDRAEDLEHPGSEIIPPGLFVLGLDRGDDASADGGGSAYPGATGGATLPDWLHNGSFQVLRRLRQDVPGWWAQVIARQGELPGAAPPDPDHLAAKLMGRWRSGTPMAHAAERDNRSVQRRIEDNDFTYADDEKGVKTPRFSHIRKVYPRDSAFQDDKRRILRRGIPYGPHFDPAAGRGHGVEVDRGLLFNVYVASIEEQFEFVQRSWANEPSFQPGSQPPDGPDPVIGNDPAAVTLRLPDQDPAQLTFRRFVSTTGAVYAFTPSLTALRQLAAGAL